MELPVPVVIFAAVSVWWTVAAWRETRPSRRMRATIFVLGGALLVCAGLLYEAAQDDAGSIVVWLPACLAGLALILWPVIWRRDAGDAE